MFSSMYFCLLSDTFRSLQFMIICLFDLTLGDHLSKVDVNVTSHASVNDRNLKESRLEMPLIGHKRSIASEQIVLQTNHRSLVKGAAADE